MEGRRRYRAGAQVDDGCRVCKEVRRHTVLVADGEGRPLRVLCDHCGSQHNYRGGTAGAMAAGDGAAGPRPGGPADARPFPMVSPRETGRGGEMDQNQPVASGEQLERMLRRVIREEGGLTPVVPADRWRDGTLVLRPGREGVQEKSWPIETFFHKVVMLRNRLRTLEQQVNASELADQTKIKLQGYISACYGSLTSFNVLFADEDDRFRGASGKGDGD